MTLRTSTSPPTSPIGPAWQIATLFPDQGHWGVGDYLLLNRSSNRLIEFVDGTVEVLDLASRTHQRIVQRLLYQISLVTEPSLLGEVIVAPYPLKVGDNRFREPDLLFVLTAHSEWLGEDYAVGADLVVEVLSEDRSRDLVTKRQEYAQAKVPEYWIVDPRDRTVRVLKLEGGEYVVEVGSEAGLVRSSVLSGLRIPADDLFFS